MNVARLLPYLPAIAYLATVWVLQVRKADIPTYLHAGALVTGLAVNAIMINWIAPIVSATFALLFFVAAIAIAGRYMTRTGIISFSVALASTPPVFGWAGLIAGSIAAAIVGFVQVARRLGNDRALFTVYESASALGVGGSVIPTKGVDADRIPAPEHAPREPDPTEPDPTANTLRSAGRMRLTPFLLFGLIAVALTTATMALPFLG